MRFWALFMIAFGLGEIGCSYGGANGTHGELGTSRDQGGGGNGDSGVADLAPPSEPDWTKLGAYLDSLFDSSLSLLRQFPSSTNYYTGGDNALAARAYEYLPTPNLTRRDLILNTLRAYKVCGCQDLPEHDATINHLVDPVVTKSAQIPLAPRTSCDEQPEQALTPTTNCGNSKNTCPAKTIRHADHSQGNWQGDYCNAFSCSTLAQNAWKADGVGTGNADLIALQILNLRNRAMSPDALWQTLIGKWDGKGMNDQATTDTKSYATAKLALFKLCARVLGKPIPIGVDEKLAAAQGPNGGIRTTYALDGSFTLDQVGNVETTSYVVLAFRKPTADF